MPAHAVVYAGLFAFSAVIGFFGVWLLSITPEQPMPPIVQHTRIVSLMTPCNKFSLSSWNFAANLAAPFFAVYMLRTLGYSMTTVIVLTTASQFSNLAALGLWGNLIDRFSNKAVLEFRRRCSSAARWHGPSQALRGSAQRPSICCWPSMC